MKDIITKKGGFTKEEKEARLADFTHGLRSTLEGVPLEELETRGLRYPDWIADWNHGCNLADTILETKKKEMQL